MRQVFIFRYEKSEKGARQPYRKFRSLCNVQGRLVVKVLVHYDTPIRLYNSTLDA